MSNEILRSLSDWIPAPLAVLFLVWWLRKNMAILEKIPDLIHEVKHLSNTLVRLEHEIQKINQLNEKVILSEHQIKTQWRRIDDVERRLREGSL